MHRALHLVAICCVLAGCHKPDHSDSAPIEITAIELHKAFAADAKAAAKRFTGKTLVITGEVKIATAEFIGRTMTREVTVPASISFKTEVDYLPHDIKYVVCHGSFEDPASGMAKALNPRIKVGELATVQCDSAKITWSDPGLYVANCWLVAKPPSNAATATMPEPPRSETKSEAPIGVAMMEEDGTIVLTLRAEGANGAIGDGRITYAPGHRDYQSILEHLGPLKKGETVPVKPWPEKR